LTEGLKGIQFIILSGYNGFEYMREVIKLGVCDYMQKPIDENELGSTLTQIIRSLAAQHLNGGQMQSINH